ncbi:MAG: C1 family peptidase [Flavisolibacter sp.]
MAKQDIMLIKEAIANEGHGWHAAPSFLANLPEEESIKFLGYVPGGDEPPLEKREEISKAHYAAFLSSSPISREAVSIPAALDWRNNNGNFVTPVKNQGGCGSCVAFGAVASVESKIKILRGAAYNVDLSEAHLFYCIARSQGRTCAGASGGWWPEPAQVGFRDIGVADEACYPYTSGDQNCTGRCSDWQSRVVRTTGYTKIGGIQATKDWIAANGPVQACFTVYSDFYYYYASGVYRKTANATVIGGHCVCIVGYDDNLQCWICKNSWGSGWGESGFFRIGYGQCGIDAENYGVNGILNTRWIRGKKVIGLWANTDERNAWVYLTDEGWQKISSNNEDGFINSLRQLSAAKATNANVDVHVDANQIDTIYVF